MSRLSKSVISFIIIFVIYNLVVLTVGGVSGHSAVFWFSFIFTDLFLVGVPCILFYEKSKHEDVAKLIFYGYSIAFWSLVFVFLEIITGAVFMIMDDHMKAAVLLHLVICAIYVLLVLMCRATEETIINVREQRRANIRAMKELSLKARTIASEQDDPELRKRIEGTADKLDFSDVVSTDVTAPYENSIDAMLDELKNSSAGKEEKINMALEIDKVIAARNLVCRENKKRG